MIWENETFLFCYNIEQLTATLHMVICNAPCSRRASAWAQVRGSIHRVWGPGLTYFPDAQEPAFFDSDNKLVHLSLAHPGAHHVPLGPASALGRMHASRNGGHC